jgi:transposase
MRYVKDIGSFVENKKVFVGIDVHYKFWVICFICDGEVVEQDSINSDYSSLHRLLKRYDSAREIRLVYEAGFSGFWLYRRLLDDGYDCMVTPAALIPQTNSKVKTDRRDAKTLASYFSANLLKAVYVPPADVESDRRVIRRRAQLAKHQNRAKNQINSFLHLHGLRRPSSIKSKWSCADRQWLRSLEFSHPSERFTLDCLLDTYEDIRGQLTTVTRYLRQLAKSENYHRHFEILIALKGVGLITAMTFLLEIYDFGRFGSSDQFSSYLGLTPAQHSSGEHTRLGHITRQGNAHLRRVLVESAWTVIRHDPHLRAKYERIRAKGTNGKKAIVAVARSLAVRLRRCLLDNVEYAIEVC